MNNTPDNGAAQALNFAPRTSVEQVEEDMSWPPSSTAMG